MSIASYRLPKRCRYRRQKQQPKKDVEDTTATDAGEAQEQEKMQMTQEVQHHMQQEIMWDNAQQQNQHLSSPLGAPADQCQVSALSLLLAWHGMMYVCTLGRMVGETDSRANFWQPKLKYDIVFSSVSLYVIVPGVLPLSSPA